MAISDYIKNYRLGTIKANDATGTPIEITFAYEPGNFSVTDLTEQQLEVVAYEDRGSFNNLAYTTPIYPSFSFTAYVTQLLGAVGEPTVFDVFLKLGAFASGISTSGSATAIPWTFDLVYELEGTDVGDASDGSITLDDCRGVVSMSEGDPSSFSCSGTAYGTVTIA